jgi:DNA mismatch endonuclease (patch repair protein)
VMKERTKELTHKIMSAVKNKDTKPEIFFRKALWKWGIKYRKNVKMFGKPDIAIKKYKLVIFIDGDYWHGNNWKIRKLPSLESELANYSDFWKNKILANIERDKKVNDYYYSINWVVLRFWQSDIENDLNECIIKTIETINGIRLSAHPTPSMARGDC